MIKRRIAEHFALGKQVFVKGGVIVMHYLLYNRQLWASRLQDNPPAPAASSCPPAYLTHHHKRLFVGTEIGIIQHRIGIKNAHYLHLVEV